MKKKNVFVTLAALAVSLALCASPAALFAATDAALFSTTYTQNARRGSLSVTGDDVYLARVLRDPGNYLYIETNYDSAFYYESCINLLGDFQEAGIVDDTYRIVLEEIVSLCYDVMNGLRCTILTADLTQYSGSTADAGFFFIMENTTGKVTDASFWMNGGVFGGYPGTFGTTEARALLDAYIKYLGFDVFADWEFYTRKDSADLVQLGYVELYAISASGDVSVRISVSDASVSFTAYAGADIASEMIRLD